MQKLSYLNYKYEFAEIQQRAIQYFQTYSITDLLSVIFIQVLAVGL